MPNRGTSRTAVTIGRAHQPLRRAVHDEVRRFIITGRFAPGERLYEEQLAAELGVSRNPVREALQALAVEGFVELEPRRGARVAVMSTKKVNDLFEVRESLEGLVAGLAAQRRTPAQLATLHEIVTEGRTAAKEGRTDLLPPLNTRFHQLLVEAAGNQLLAESLGRLEHVIQWIYTKRIRERLANSWQEHFDIVAAIEDADPVLAQERARLHIQHARAAFFAGVELPA
jgi:DNA-binding GntR family transcriptional regulator